MYQSLEIFCGNGKSYFINLFNKNTCNNVFTILNNINNGIDDKNKFQIINENTNINEEMKTMNLKKIMS